PNIAPPANYGTLSSTGTPSNQTPFSTSNAVGTIAGSADVNATGAATYTIPLNIPHGTAGMEPSLSIAYNSQAGNGLLGKGWDLGGLSAITKANKTLYYNNETTNEPTLSYGFVLDGSRLIKLSGTYGSTGCSYGFEIENYSRVEQFADYFIVKSKDGKTLEYGNTADSRILANGNTLMWRINKIADANGNYMIFTYGQTNGESWIQTIEYTGNDAAGLSPYHKIQFIYDQRSDNNTCYSEFGKVAQPRLLASIVMYTSNIMFKKYDMNYASNLVYSQLSELRETGIDGTSLNTTKMDWGTSISQKMETLNGSKSHTNQKANFIPGDFNGDGLTDYLAVSSAYLKYKLAHSQNPQFPAYTDNSWKLYQNGVLLASGTLKDGLIIQSLNTIDTDRDGKTELLYHWEWLGQIRTRIYEFNGTAFVEKTGTTKYNINDEFKGPNTNIIVGNFDGNNEPDYIVYNNVAITMAVNLSFVPTNFLATLNSPLRVVDFDGDGKTELMAIFPFYSIIINLTSAGYSQPFISPANVVNVSADAYKPLVTHFTADFNGDGKVDILQYSPNNGNPVWNMYLFNGKSFETPVNVALPNYDTNNDDTEVLVSDYNNDGKADVFILNQNTNANQLFCDLYLSKDGLHFVAETQTFTKVYQGNLLPENVSSFDYNNDGKTDIIIEAFINDNPHIITYNALVNDELIDKITDGFDNTTIFNYNILSNNSYVKSKNASGDLMYMGGGTLKVVSNIQRPNGVGGLSTTNFKYEDLVINTFKGGASFEKITNTNTSTNLATSAFFTINPIAMPLGNITPTSSTTLTKTITQTGYVFTITGEKSINANTLDNNTTSSEVSYDANGNIVTSTNKVFDGLSATGTPIATETSTSSSFVNGASWLPSLPKTIIASKTTTAGTSTFTTTLVYDAKGNLTSKIDFDELPKAVITTYNNRNNLGIPKTVTVTATGLLPKISTVEFDNTGRFVLKSTNELTQSTTSSYNSLGQRTSTTGIDGITVSYIYDGFSNLIQTNAPTGYAKTQSIWTSNNPVNSVIAVISQVEGLADQTQYYDALGRVIKTSKGTVNNKTLESVTFYNANGTLQKQSISYIQGEIPVYTEYDSYDSYLRPKTISTNTNTVTYTYGTRKLTITNPQGNTTETNYNALGQKISVIDAKGSSVTYTYDQLGNVVNSGTNIITYDTYGRQASLTDPNTGTISYDYDAYGRLKTQTDAAGTYTNTYDELGRISSKIHPSDNTVYTYIASGNGIGQIATITNTTTGNKQTYLYDSFGNITSFLELNELQTFETKYQYNLNGTVNQITYPNNFVVKQIYKNGFLKSVTTNTDIPIWTQGVVTGTETNDILGAAINIKHSYDPNFKTLTGITATAGSNTPFNYSYNFEKTTGNLLSRKDVVRNLTETFTYDELDRLKTMGHTILVKTMDYASNGNINAQTGIGSYTYDATKLHQLIGINDQTQFPSLAQNLKYSIFNKVTEVKEGNLTYTISYGPNQERVKMSFTNVATSSQNFTRYYATGYEKEIKGAITKETYYISGANGTVAMYVKTNGVGKLYYLVQDHLGSTMQLLNEDGTHAEPEQSFDAWGRRRNPTNWSYTGFTVSTITARGYTGHEHLDDVNIINMNGRLYDPLTCRMFSADPYIQAPDNTQSFNRYSYCWNNPLSNIDPNGEELVTAAIIIGAIIGSYIGGSIANHSYNPGNWNFSSGKTWGYMIGGAFIGGVSGGLGGAVGGVAGASAAASGSGTFMAGVAGGAMGGLVAGGINGAGMAALSGGNAGDIAGAFTNGAMMGSVSGAASGGISSMFGNFSGVEGGALKNAAYELGFYGLKGGASGIGSGGVLSAMTQDPSYMWKGALYGAAFEGSMAALRIGAYGASFIPDPEIYCEFENFGQIYRRGSIFTPKGYGVTLGRNVVVKLTGDTDYDRFTLHHETGHIVDINKMGVLKFYGRTAYEYIKYGRNETYTLPGTLEYSAEYYAYKKLG
ncbi:MAG: hypothetical protein RL060_1238, partial [Bacteroidota bacterium]